MKLRILLAALVAAAATSACAPARLTVKPEFFHDRQVRVGVALTPRPEAAAHKVGAQGLLDMAINAGMAADLKEHLQRVDLSEFDQIRDRFTAELSRRGMKVVAVTGTIDPAKYPPRPETAPKIENAFERDLGALGTQLNLDTIVLLQVRRYGTLRSYYGFIPLGAPSGFCEVVGQMVDLRTGSVLWQTAMTEQQASVAAIGDWDQPPQYPNLTAALRKAISNGKEFLWEEFFAPGAPAQKPASAPVAAAGM